MITGYDGKVAHVAYFTGTDGPHRKTSMQLMDHLGEIHGYAKMTQVDFIRPFLANEAQALTAVAELELTSCETPRIVEYRDTSESTVLATDSLRKQGMGSPYELGSAHRRFLQELSHRTRAQSPRDLMASLHRAADNCHDDLRWAARLKSALVLLQPRLRTLQFCRAHGDFTPWNTFLLPEGRIYVFDWEYSNASWPVGYDCLHFLLSVEPRMPSPDHLSAAVRVVAEDYFGGNIVAARESALLSLLCHAGLYIRRAADAGHSATDWDEHGRRAAMIDQLLEQVRAHPNG
ncbi:aminoglycoside phosphotransferase family protein [Planctomycetota bacterium]|nr:aminoglycoside phosphotransferase family protein [Planctomycetota bacterium]